MRPTEGGERTALLSAGSVVPLTVSADSVSVGGGGALTLEAKDYGDLVNHQNVTYETSRFAFMDKVTVSVNGKKAFEYTVPRNSTVTAENVYSQIDKTFSSPVLKYDPETSTLFFGYTTSYDVSTGTVDESGGSNDYGGSTTTYTAVKLDSGANVSGDQTVIFPMSFIYISDIANMSFLCTNPARPTPPDLLHPASLLLLEPAVCCRSIR